MSGAAVVFLLIHGIQATTPLSMMVVEAAVVVASVDPSLTYYTDIMSLSWLAAAIRVAICHEALTGQPIMSALVDTSCGRRRVCPLIRSFVEASCLQLLVSALLTIGAHRH